MSAHSDSLDLLRLYGAHMLCKKVRVTVNHAHRKHMVVRIQRGMSICTLSCTLFRVGCKHQMS